MTSLCSHLADCLHEFQGGVVEMEVRSREVRKDMAGVVSAVSTTKSMVELLSDTGRGLGRGALFMIPYCNAITYSIATLIQCSEVLMPYIL